MRKYNALICSNCKNFNMGSRFIDSKCKNGGRLNFSKQSHAYLPTKCDLYDGKVAHYTDPYLKIDIKNPEIIDMFLKGLLLDTTNSPEITERFNNGTLEDFMKSYLKGIEK